MTSATQSVLGAAIAVAALSIAPRAIGAQQPFEPQTIVRDWQTVNRHATVVDSGGRQFVPLDEGPTMGLVWTPLDFTDGEIELDVHGRDVLQKSFLRVAFHIVSDTAFDAVYLRPVNFRASGLHASRARASRPGAERTNPRWGWPVGRRSVTGRLREPGR